MIPKNFQSRQEAKLLLRLLKLALKLVYLLPKISCSHEDNPHGKLKVTCSSTSTASTWSTKIKPNAVSQTFSRHAEGKREKPSKARKQQWSQQTKLAPLQTKILLLIAGNINVLNPLCSGTVCVAWLQWHRNHGCWSTLEYSGQ